MFKQLEKTNSHPSPFQFYTADALWTDRYTSKKMLESHLNEDFEVSIQNREFINNSVDWIVNHFALDQNRRVADFGCGMGSYATRLAKKGADVTGIDFSEAFIQHAKEVAKQKGLDINYAQQNYLEFEAEERFDLITLLLCDFCALSPSQRRTMLEKFCKFLQPVGSALIDACSIPDLLYYIQERTNLTRTTIFEILKKSDRIGEVFLNPQLFLDNAVSAIKDVLFDLMIDGIKYERIGTKEYEMRLFEDYSIHVNDLTFNVSKKGKTIYSNLCPLDSNVEYEFARECESRDDIEFYFKLLSGLRLRLLLGIIILTGH